MRRKLGIKGTTMTYAQCPEDCERGSLRLREGGKDTENYYCSSCRNEWFPFEVKIKQYKVGSFVNADGERRYTHHTPENIRSGKTTGKKRKRPNRLSKRENNLLSRIRGNK